MVIDPTTVLSCRCVGHTVHVFREGEEVPRVVEMDIATGIAKQTVLEENGRIAMTGDGNHREIVYGFVDGCVACCAHGKVRLP